MSASPKGKGQAAGSRPSSPHSGSEDDDGESVRSVRSNDSGNSGQSGLFMATTIARDDTLGKATKQRGMLAKLTSQLNSGELLLNSTGNASLAPIPGAAMPFRHPPPPHAINRHPLPPGRGGPRPPYPYPPGARPGQPPMPLPPNPMGFPRRPAFLPPPPIPPGPNYPFYKTTKVATWRKSLEISKGEEAGPQGTEDPNDAKDTANGPSVVEPTQSAHPSVVISAPAPDNGDQAKTAASGSQDEANGEDTPGSTHSDDGRAETEQSEPQAIDEALLQRHNLSIAIGDYARNHLSFDITDQTHEVTQFVGYLLDTIHVLEKQVRFDGAASDSSSSSGPHEAAEPEEPKPRSQVLHRVFCSNGMHYHDRKIYEDEPTFKYDVNGDERGMVGDVIINNLDVYLDRHPTIALVIMKEHNCIKEQKRRLWYDPGPGASTSGRSERIVIASSLLRKALSQVAEYAPFHDPDADDEEKEMDAPYSFIFHHREKLDALAQVEEFREVLAPLQEFIKNNYDEEYAEADAMFSRGFVNEKHLSKLFKPNEMIIHRPKGSKPMEAHVLRSFYAKDKDWIEIRGWSWQYSGTELQRKSWYTLMNAVSDEEVPISGLPVHPVAHAKIEDVERIQKRGEKFWNLRRQVLTCYTGWDSKHDHFYVDARFMVDTATYQIMYNHISNYTRDEGQQNKYDKWPMTINRREEIEANMLMLLPPTMFGFNLHEKKWVTLDVENFRPVDWNKKAFDRLVLDPKTKELIYALVDVQAHGNKKMDDIITGKGNGLIILLHGSPGTGKTLTAESVAEIAEKPLYRVTCGDIGTEAKDVEKYLQTVLYLGKIWDCVLLLDEADVFLEERTMADLQRNSLVSVFLRILEYYEGILILTSNRVGTFDEAFKSRIQVAIHYDHLSRKSRKAIWRNFFDMIEEGEEEANMPELERRLDDLAAEEMNGRQIRNALLTARQLAKHREEKLDWEHLSQVMKTSAAFNKYLKAVRGHSDEQWAREEMLR